jgi:3D (Asp-Asp-Asp) domain-containing protein
MPAVARFAAALTLLLFVSPSPLLAREKIGRFRITFYYLVDEADYKPSTRWAIRDMRGNVIARTSFNFRRHLLMEGSGRLRDGRVVTYQRHLHGEARFRVTKHEYGAGIGTCPLVPYRTIAVDPKLIPFGTRVFIPQFVGIELPDGTKHDGFFMAHDRSHYVRGGHIDLFMKHGKKSVRPFTSRGFRTGKRVDVYREARPQKGGCHSD